MATFPSKAHHYVSLMRFKEDVSPEIIGAVAETARRLYADYSIAIGPVTALRNIEGPFHLVLDLTFADKAAFDSWFADPATQEFSRTQVRPYVETVTHISYDEME